MPDVPRRGGYSTGNGPASPKQAGTPDTPDMGRISGLAVPDDAYALKIVVGPMPNECEPSPACALLPVKGIKGWLGVGPAGGRPTRPSYFIAWRMNSGSLLGGRGPPTAGR